MCMPGDAVGCADIGNEHGEHVSGAPQLSLVGEEEFPEGSSNSCARHLKQTGVGWQESF